MGGAIARLSMSVLQIPWRTNILEVGRFGGERGEASESTIRQTHPTYERLAFVIAHAIFGHAMDDSLSDSFAARFLRV